MNTPASPEPSAENQNLDCENEIDTETLETLQQQQLTLKLEIERLHREVNQLRAWFQTMGSGLFIAILIAIGISSWFAYRILAQEQIARQEGIKAAATQSKLLERVKELEEQLKGLNQEVPEKLSELTDATQFSEQELLQFSDRLDRVEAKQRELSKPPSRPEPPKNRSESQ